MEWNNDEISKLIDFTEKRSFMYNSSDAAAALTMLSAIFLVQETVMNLHQIFCASFCYQFLVPDSGACVAGFSLLWSQQSTVPMSA